MPRILITAFAPFLQWPTNASEQILSNWQERRPVTGNCEVITEVLPVDYAQAEPRIRKLLADEFDFALHLGQSARIDFFALEMVALNLKHDAQTPLSPLNPGGPAAYISPLPLESWAADLSQQGIPAQVSLHAGSYLCNAAYFWSNEAMHQQHRRQRQLADRSLFVHVPHLDRLSADEGHALDLGRRMVTRLLERVESYLTGFAGTSFGTA